MRKWNLLCIHGMVLICCVFRQPAIHPPYEENTGFPPPHPKLLLHHFHHDFDSIPEAESVSAIQGPSEYHLVRCPEADMNYCCCMKAPVSCYRISPEKRSINFNSDFVSLEPKVQNMTWLGRTFSLSFDQDLTLRRFICWEKIFLSVHNKRKW